MSDYLDVHVSGDRLRLSGIELYPAPAVARWRGTIGLAQQQLSGSLGFSDPPGWAIGGAVEISQFDEAAIPPDTKAGLDLLERASGLLRELRNAGRLFPVGQVRNIRLASPTSWFVQSTTTAPVEIKSISMFSRGKFLKDNGLTKDDVVDGVVNVSTPTMYTALGSDFLSCYSEERDLVEIRWASVDTYQLIREGSAKGWT